MTAPNGGSVSVDVVPDTTGFEKALDAALKRLGPVNVRVKPSDVPGFHRALQKALNRLDPINVKVEPNTAKFEAKLKAAVKGMSVEVSVDLDTGAAAASLEAFKRAVGSTQIEINLDLDTGAAAASLAALRAAATSVDLTINVKVTGDVAALAQIAAVHAAATALGSLSPTVHLGTTGSAGGAAAAGRRDGGAYQRAFQSAIRSSLSNLRAPDLTPARSGQEQELRDLFVQAETLGNQRIGIDIDDESAHRELDRLEREFARVEQNGVTVEARFDAGRARAELVRFRESLNPSEARANAAGGAYGNAFARGLRAATANIRPIEINASSTDADREIEEVRRRMATLGNQRIGVDISTTAARREMDFLQAQLARLSAQSPDVRVQADTRAAALHLRNLQRQLDQIGRERVRPDVDSNSFIQAGGRAQTLIAVIASIAPLGVPAIAAATAALVALGAAAAVAGAAVGTALLGFSGIGGALTALRAPKTGGGGGGADQAAQLARKRADALLSVQAAQRGLESAELDAAEAAIQSARKAEAADRALLQAQRDLTDARRDAIRAIEDLALANRKAVIDTEEAEIALRKAQENLNQVNFDESKTTDERREAALAVDKARIAIDEQAIANGRLREETESATKAGVDGAQSVLDAQLDLADAERDRADVAREVAREQRDTAISLLEANLALEKSQRDYIDALNDTGTSGAGGIDKVAEAMKKLSPAGREFVYFLNDEVLPAIDKLKSTAQESMLPGIQKALRSLAPLFGTVNTLVAVMGKALGDAAQRIAASFQSPAGLALLNYLITEGPKIIGYITEIGVALGEIGSILIVAFGSTTDQIFSGLANSLRDFATWLARAVNTPEFVEFLAYIRETGPQVMGLLADMVVVLIKLGIALAPLGAILLQSLVWLFDWLAGLDPNTILYIFAVLAVVIAAATGSVGALVVAVVLGVALLVQYWLVYLRFLNDAWDNWLMPIFNAIGAFFTETIPGWLNTLGQWWTNTWNSITTGTNNAVNAIRTSVTGAFQAMYAGVVGWLGNIWASISTTFNGIYNTVTTSISGAISWVAQSFNNLVAWIGQLPGRISASVSNMFAGIPNAIRNALNQAIGYWNSFASMMSIGGFGLPRMGLFADGGIVPGYTPGRDTAIIGVGGGEAVMRPEWTRAVGPSYVNAANAAARSGGVSGVQKFVEAFGAPRGFATGGIVPSNLGIASPMPRRDSGQQQPVGQGQPLVGAINLYGSRSISRTDAQKVVDAVGWAARTGIVNT